MTHKYPVGAVVYLQSSGRLDRVSSGRCKIVRHMPVERDNRVLYRVRSETETFERTVDEDALSKAV